MVEQSFSIKIDEDIDNKRVNMEATLNYVEPNSYQTHEENEKQEKLQEISNVTTDLKDDNNDDGTALKNSELITGRRAPETNERVHNLEVARTMINKGSKETKPKTTIELRTSLETYKQAKKTLQMKNKAKPQETEEQHEERLRKRRASDVIRRSSETAEQRALRFWKDRKRTVVRRSLETKEQRIFRLWKQRKQIPARKPILTEEQRMERNRKAREYYWRKRTIDQQAEHLRKIHETKYYASLTLVGKEQRKRHLQVEHTNAELISSKTGEKDKVQSAPAKQLQQELKINASSTSSENKEQRLGNLERLRECIALRRSRADEMDNKISASKADRSDTEKVKRRMIRTIGRLISEKKPEDELWEYMEKEYGKKCKILWDRMRSLTLKKLKMLYDVDDVINNVPKVARMTLTDWLIFDLVLAHEKIELIDMRKLRSDNPTNALRKLFALVTKFDIEGKSGEQLTLAWIAATVHYNATGHQCSPMLLQRRWYQLKEVTRASFYNFWFIFRGTQRQLSKAKEESPISELQRDIALKYNDIITVPFKQWEDCIKDRTVIMPEEFEQKMRTINLMKTNDLTVPDLVLVEPKINTIDLCDSEEEVVEEVQNKDETEQTPAVPQVTVKNEPIDLDDDEEEEQAKTPTESDQNTENNFDDEIHRLQMVSNEINSDSDDDVLNYDDERESDCETPDGKHSETEKAVESFNNNCNIDINVELPENTEENAKDNNTEDVIATDILESQNTSTANETIDVNTIEKTAEGFNEPDLIVKVENDAVVTEEDVLPVISTVTSAGVPVDLETAVDLGGITNPTPLEGEATVIDDLDNRAIGQCYNDKITPHNSGIDSEIITENDHNSEVDNEIITEYDHNSEVDNEVITEDDHNSVVDNDMVVENVNNMGTQNREDISYEDIIKIESTKVQKVDEFNFDDVPMDIDFADDGIQLVDDGIEYTESDERNEQTEDIEPKIDEKLLLLPVVYTTKIDNMTVVKQSSIIIHDGIKDKTVIDQILRESKSISKLAPPLKVDVKIEPDTVNVMPTLENEGTAKLEPRDDIINEVEEAEEEEDEEEEVERLKPTSYLLRKPRYRTYNPIQLCKNPDFNTRLKRLPVSFYTFPSNRILLNECKPMTIDVSKAFETKLNNGTLYLTKSEVQLNPVKVTNEHTVTSSVAPSAPPVQSLLDVDKILEEELKKRVVERNRAINLPDITEVRRINQQLLTAEVIPLRKSYEIEPTAAVDNAIVIGDNRVDSQVDAQSNDDDVTPIPYLEPIPQKEQPKSNVPTITDKNTTSDERDNLNKVRKKNRRNYHPKPSWLQKPNYLADTSDILLTVDTLYKMLFVIDAEAVANSSFQKYVKETLKSKVVLDTKTILKKKKKSKVSTEPVKEPAPAEPKSQPNDQSEPVGKKPAKAKVKVVYDSNNLVIGRSKFCCWSSHQLAYIQGKIKRAATHKCKTYECKCCCEDVLNDYVAENKRNMAREIEILQTACESIKSHENQNEPKSTCAVYTMTSDIELIQPIQSLTAVIPTASTKENAPIILEPRDTQNKEIVSEIPIPMTSSVQEPSILQKMVEAQSKKNQTDLNRASQEGLQSVNCPCIMIDGTKGTVRNAEKYRQGKKGKLYINKKTSTDRPIYIGKNKLLLTNVKLREPTEPSPPLVTVPAAENLQMPEGIQIILLPNGTLTYTIDSTEKVTDDQVAVMPSILAAIQRQINSGNLAMVPTGTVFGNVLQGDVAGDQDISINLDKPAESRNGDPKVVETIVLDNNDDAYVSVPTSSQVSNNDVLTAVTEDVNKSDSVSTERQHFETPMIQPQLPTVNETVVSETTISNTEITEVGYKESIQSTDDSQTPLCEETNKPVETEKQLEDCTQAQNIEDKTPEEKQPLQKDRKSLLSDLMEMSGISEEDIAPAPVTIPTPVDVETNLSKNTVFSTQRNVSIAPKITNQKSAKDVYADLSTVNSFDELKYAYQNNGLFFKLDLETGVIVPITLCIKKKARAKAVSITDSVIDLTDDADMADDENITFNTNSSNPPENIKTTNVFKRVLSEVKVYSVKDNPARTSKKTRPIILRKNMQKSLLRITKHNTELKNDSKDSNAPLVEEYLDISSENESDDEPLAKKARRRVAEINQNPSNEQRLSESVPEPSTNEEEDVEFLDEELTETLEQEFSQTATESLPSAVPSRSPPKPTHLVLTRDKVHEAVPIDMLYQNQGDDSDSQEDCILGV